MLRPDVVWFGEGLDPEVLKKTEEEMDLCDLCLVVSLFPSLSQQTRDIHPMMFQCCATVFDAGPTLKQHWVNAPCLLGIVMGIVMGTQ